MAGNNRRLRDWHNAVSGNARTNKRSSAVIDCSDHEVFLRRADAMICGRRLDTRGC
ncbi:hypothetical protein AB0F91_26550 [Amycolatopsis sp. NPDC023774]|uniref:hypothetical protein n=1 Tax=Amycolatopsis sp. NPDC023774 TaxID=3155015 RepID=UPI0033DAF611